LADPAGHAATTSAPTGPPTDTSLDERRAAAAQVFVEDPARPALSDAARHHLSRVLRLADGERVVAADGTGGWTPCAWRAATEALEPLGDAQFDQPAGPTLTVAFAPAKGDRPEWVVQKLTELGVDVIVPLVTERGVVRWAGARATQAVERLQRVAVAAAAQSRRVHLPQVTAPQTVAQLRSDPAAGGVPPLALADPGGAPLTPAVRTVAVGPEGGWGPAEQAFDLPRVTLGPHVLRAETAAVAAGVLLAALRAGTVAPTTGGASDATSVSGGKGRRAPE
jgi:16S rRNA (uracil1498-N3)-methyltransferase